MDLLVFVDKNSNIIDALDYYKEIPEFIKKNTPIGKKVALLNWLYRILLKGTINVLAGVPKDMELHKEEMRYTMSMRDYYTDAYVYGNDDKKFRYDKIYLIYDHTLRSNSQLNYKRYLKNIFSNIDSFVATNVKSNKEYTIIEYDRR